MKDEEEGNEYLCLSVEWEEGFYREGNEGIGIRCLLE